MSKIKTRSNKGNSETTSDTTGALGAIRRRLVFPPTSIFTMKKTEANKKLSNNMPQDSNTQNINGNGTSQILVLREMALVDIGLALIKSTGSLLALDVKKNNTFLGQKVLIQAIDISNANLAESNLPAKSAESDGGLKNSKTANTPATGLVF